MPYYRRVGEVPPKRHTQFSQPDGSLYAEELMGQEGFSSDSSLLYHRYRHAIGDECVYVEAGSARLESSFGTLEIAAGDYAIIPTSVIHRIVPTGDRPLRTLVIEATGHIGPPRRYLSVRGQFLEHAPYCERDLRAPAEPLQVEGSDVEVYV